MKNLIYYLRSTLLFAILPLVIIVSCKKDADEELNLTRRFSPSTITPKNGETAVSITWTPSLFSTTGDVEYVVEVSKDLTFANVEFTTKTSSLTTSVNDDKIEIKKDYYARIKALGKDGAEDSKWSVSPSFKITGEQFLLVVPESNLIDKAAKIIWKVNPGLTKITLTPTGGASFDVTISAGEQTDGLKLVTGLTPGTTYTAEIFQGVKSKGVITFKTKAGIAGNVIDLSGTTGDPTILVTTLTTAPSGSVIVLRRNETYKVTAFTFTKSVTIISELGFGTNYPIIRSAGSFTIAASTTIDSIVFKNLIIKGQNILNAPASYDNHYVFNVSNDNAKVNILRFDNCTIKILRGIVRGQTGTPGSPPVTPKLVVNNYFINNCVMDSIREYGILSTANTSAAYFVKVTVTNSTAYRFRKFIDHRVYGNTSITISNCTFNEVVAGAAAPANAIIDYQTIASGAVTITNCIFGKTWNETGVGTAVWGLRAASGTPTVSGSYSTSDFVNTDNPITGLIGYSGASTSLFTDPNNGNFTIKDPTFVGKSTAGDPRWRN